MEDLQTSTAPRYWFSAQLRPKAARGMWWVKEVVRSVLNNRGKCWEACAIRHGEIGNKKFSRGDDLKTARNRLKPPRDCRAVFDLAVFGAHVRCAVTFCDLVYTPNDPGGHCLIVDLKKNGLIQLKMCGARRLIPQEQCCIQIPDGYWNWILFLVCVFV